MTASQNRRVRFIVNPASGSGRRKGLAALAASELRNASVEFDMVETRGPGDAEGLARQALSEGCDIVVAVGGDGTVNEVARGLLGQRRAALAIVPMGSGNGLARHMGIPMPGEAVAGAHRHDGECGPAPAQQPPRVLTHMYFSRGVVACRSSACCS